MMCTRVCDRQEDFLPLQSLLEHGKGGGEQELFSQEGKKKFTKNIIRKLGTSLIERFEPS
jgi:hypothetical protein